MNKLLFSILVLVSACSDTENLKETNETQIKSELPETIDNHSLIKNSANDSEQAKIWLIEAIDLQFNGPIQSFEKITTKEYYGFKSDLIGSNYEYGIDLDSIRKKWSYKYKISSDDIDVGFLIGAQDNGKIEVESCHLLSKLPNSKFIFGVSLYDTLFKEHYKSEITVIPYNGTYAIDNVKEYFR